MDAGKAGITLVEQVVALGVIVLLGAAVIPHVIGTIDRSRVDESVASLQEIVAATTDFNLDVRAAAATIPYPGSLSQLTTAITSGSLTVTDICGDSYSAAHAAAWRGPYISRVVPVSGIPIGIGTVADDFALVTSGGATFLAIEVTGVTVEHATLANDAVDGDESLGDLGGTVRWSPAAGDAEGRTTLQYLRPVPAC